MLILRGNSGPPSRPDENGKLQPYTRGALHEWAATEYARRKGYEPTVLDVSGDPPKKGDRSHSCQTLMAVDRFYHDKSIAAFYGFSGGGYNVWWILRALKGKEEELKRIKSIVVLGARDRKNSEYDSSRFKGGNWQLVYRIDPKRYAKCVSKDADCLHMFGPESLLEEPAR